jgi:hypothetical protein
MIVVSVRLVSAISRTRDRELARMEIANIGGDLNCADYSAVTLHGRDTKQLDRRVVQRGTTVGRYARQRDHVWKLVAKALSGMGYGK